MRLLLMGAIFVFHNKLVPTINVKSEITPLSICYEDYECELPYRCCSGLLFNYCCFHGGTPAPIPVPIPIPNPR